MKHKLISILIPIRNERENLPILVDQITDIFKQDLTDYQYEIIFADNKSDDGSREWIEKKAKTNKSIKAVFNTTNIVPGSAFNIKHHYSGDCAIIMAGDLQDPTELIPEFVKAWEDGYKIVIGKKTQTQGNPISYLVRDFYYKLLNKISDTDLINQFTGFGLYDKEWMDFIKQFKDPALYERGVIAKYGFERKEIEFVQPTRKHGQSKIKFVAMYNSAMEGITSFSDFPLRLATMLGFASSIVSFLLGMIYLIRKLTNWDQFDAGMAPILISTLFIGSIILFFIGIIGEYIININKRVMNHPYVLEEKRINLDDSNSSNNKTTHPD